MVTIAQAPPKSLFRRSSAAPSSTTARRPITALARNTGGSKCGNSGNTGNSGNSGEFRGLGCSGSTSRRRSPRAVEPVWRASCSQSPLRSSDSRLFSPAALVGILNEAQKQLDRTGARDQDLHLVGHLRRPALDLPYRHQPPQGRQVLRDQAGPPRRTLAPRRPAISS